MSETDLRREVEEALERIDTQTYYELLDVERNASADDVRSAFRKKAKRFHVDAHAEIHDPELRQQMQAVFGVLSEAQKTLIRDELRAEYDASLNLGDGADTDAGEEVSNIFRAEQLFKGALRLIERGEFRLARKRLEECIVLNPTEQEHHVWLAWVHYSMLRIEENEGRRDPVQLERALRTCREKVEKLSRDNPKAIAAFVVLGHMSRIEGDLAAAKKYFEKVLQISPRHTEAQSNLRYLTRRTKEPKGFFASLFGKKS